MGQALIYSTTSPSLRTRSKNRIIDIEVVHKTILTDHGHEYGLNNARHVRLNLPELCPSVCLNLSVLLAYQSNSNHFATQPTQIPGVRAVPCPRAPNHASKSLTRQCKTPVRRRCWEPSKQMHRRIRVSGALLCARSCQRLRGYIRSPFQNHVSSTVGTKYASNYAKLRIESRDSSSNTNPDIPRFKSRSES
ncbi:hypothetical protein BDN72DRAFT_500078 [Pluteus cervinus]|uniref:Uncharacterized protein n=1 Tax=Pluteus cervinus TaxID=181527 RepID=A0ACD3AYV5_9AGAR|nr:hypothetical protein BDN72DRAFT_500078 [Pluteus cervinus]